MEDSSSLQFLDDLTKIQREKERWVNQKFVYVHRDDYFALKIGELDGLNIV